MKILIIQENGRHEENRHLKECFCFQREYEKLGDDSELEVIALAGQELATKHTHKKRAITIKELAIECLEKRKSA